MYSSNSGINNFCCSKFDSVNINEDCARCSSLHVHVEPRLPDMDVFFFFNVRWFMFGGLFSEVIYLLHDQVTYRHFATLQGCPSSFSLSAYLVTDRVYMYMAFSGMPQDIGTCTCIVASHQHRLWWQFTGHEVSSKKITGPIWVLRTSVRRIFSFADAMQGHLEARKPPEWVGVA